MNFLKLRPLFNKQLLNASCRLTRAASSSPSPAGISFQVSEEQQSLLDLAEKFSREEIIPRAAEYDRKNRFVFSSVTSLKTLFSLNRLRWLSVGYHSKGPRSRPNLGRHSGKIWRSRPEPADDLYDRRASGLRLLRHYNRYERKRTR